MASLDGLQPGVFCWEPGRGMVIANELRLGSHVVYLANVFRRRRLAVENDGPEDCCVAIVRRSLP